MRTGSSRWTWPVLAVIGGVVLPRLLLGYLFGGTQDQRHWVALWSLIEQHGNPYTDAPYNWPPLWWILLGLWLSGWHLLAAWAPSVAIALGPSFCLKLLYYVFEIVLAFFLARHVERATRDRSGLRPSPGGISKPACLFLLCPVTWIITSLHGNFDVIPTFFTIAAFLALAHEPTETSAILAGASIGLAAMARTFPVIFAVPLFVHVLRKFRASTALAAGALTILPSFVSMYPLYLLDPAAISGALAYRGIPGGWWGLAVLARLTVSDELALRLEALGYPVFYAGMLALLALLGLLLFRGRIGILKAGALLAVGMFCFAPTISSQNFYFLAPWAFWYAFVRKQRAARVFLWAVNVVLLLNYVIVPGNAEHPAWFQGTYDFPEAGHVSPIPSPSWLVSGFALLSHLLLGDSFGFSLHLLLLSRVALWAVLWVWFVALWKDPGETARRSDQGQTALSLSDPFDAKP